jgi:hypothetical protein
LYGHFSRPNNLISKLFIQPCPFNNARISKYSGQIGKSIMAEIVNLVNLRAETLEKKVFGPWKKRFGFIFPRETRVLDIPDKTLLYLSQPGEESALAFYELIMGALDLGPAIKFSYLDKQDQLYVMEIHLFLSDLFRFEMMRRLGWIDPIACGMKSLIELVKHFDNFKNFCRETPPQLSQTHPDFSAYQYLHERDREGFIRRLLPGALDIFQRKLV